MKYRKTTLKIIALFSAAIFASFIPELIPSFFGDWVCKGNCGYGPNYVHNSTTHWGWRHYLYILMGVTLFIYNIFVIIEED